MGISKEQAVKELQNRDFVFVAYSQATRLPYVTCDEETYNDQAWVFSHRGRDQGVWKEMRGK